MREIPHQKWAYIFLNIWFVIAFLALAIWLIDYFSQVFLIVVFGGIIALVLQPPTRWLVERTRLPWWGAAVIVYMAFLVVAILIILLLSIVFSGQSSDALSELPELRELAQRITEDLKDVAARFGLDFDVQEFSRRMGQSIDRFLSQLLGNIIGAVSTIATAVASMITTLFLGAFFLVFTPSISQTAVRLLPEVWDARFHALWADLKEILVRWAAGISIKAVIVGTAVAIGMYFFGLPFPLFLGVFAGFMNLIPIFGSIIAAVPAVILALFESIPLALGVIIYYIIVNQLEAGLLDPLVIGKAVNINPVLIVVALGIGFEVAGVFGMILAAPAMSILLTAVRHIFDWYVEYTGTTKGMQM
ncbi:MAG: AI-2E family transporter [Candidatus Aquicultorales bacterium]